VKKGNLGYHDRVRAALLAIGVIGCGRIGFEAAPAYYISPTGSDAGPGTKAQPFRSFPHALSQLAPGDTLIVLDGNYASSAGTGYLAVDCAQGATACKGQPCENGEPGRPITVRAEHERQATLRSESRSSSAPIQVTSCSGWLIEGLTAIVEDNPAGDPSAGSPVFAFQSSDLWLRRLLVSGHNRYLNSHPVAILESNSVVVEESEIYDFASSGVSVWLSNDVVLRRNYINPRGAMDVPGGWDSGYAWANNGISFAHSARGIAENNVLEGDFARGIAIDAGLGGIGASDDHVIAGNLVRLAANSRDAGLFVRSFCNGVSPCDDDALVVSRSRIVDNVIVGNGIRALWARGAQDLLVRNLSAHDSEVTIDRASDNAGLVRSTAMVSNVLVTGSGGGISVQDQSAWTVEYSNAFVDGSPFVPAQGGNFTTITTLDPVLGDCLAMIPRTSTMYRVGAGGADIGATIVDRYLNGVLTNEPLWASGTGMFPCGAVVQGYNDVATFPGAVCATTHERFHVGPGGCVP
jgi:hypothetical protein